MNLVSVFTISIWAWISIPLSIRVLENNTFAGLIQILSGIVLALVATALITSVVAYNKVRKAIVEWRERA